MSKHIVGKCPNCGGQVLEFSNFYGCSNWRSLDGGCNFTLPKRFTGKEIPVFALRELLQRKQSRKLDGFVSRQGGTFSATLELVFNGEKWRLKMKFEN